MMSDMMFSLRSSMLILLTWSPVSPLRFIIIIYDKIAIETILTGFLLIFSGEHFYKADKPSYFR